MTWRDVWLIVGLVMLALAALALWRAIRAVMRRARADQPQRWVGLVFRVSLIVSLVWLGMETLVNLPPPELVNRPAPAAADAIVAYVQSSRTGGARTLIGASARDGATRWRRDLGGEIELVDSPAPGILIVSVYAGPVYALRASDGATLWRLDKRSPIHPSYASSDGQRVYLLANESSEPGASAVNIEAYTLATGAPVWSAPLPVDLTEPPAVETGGGLLFLAGQAGEPGASPATWGVVALDAATGARRWSNHGELTADLSPRVVALFVVGDAVVVAPEVGPLTALRASDGAVAWSGAPNLGDPTIPPHILSAAADDQTVYITAQPSKFKTDAQGNFIIPPVTLLALDAGGGTERWRARVAPTGSQGGVAVSEGVLLLGRSIMPSFGWEGYSPNTSLLTAYDAASGRALWHDNANRAGVSWDMTPIVTPLAKSGAVYLLGIEVSPYVQDPCVIFCPGVSWVYAVNLRTGAPWWRARMGYANLTHWVI